MQRWQFFSFFFLNSFGYSQVTATGAVIDRDQTSTYTTGDRVHYDVKWQMFSPMPVMVDVLQEIIPVYIDNETVVIAGTVQAWSYSEVWDDCEAPHKDSYTLYFKATQYSSGSGVPIHENTWIYCSDH